MIEVKDLGLEIIERSKQKGLVLRATGSAPDLITFLMERRAKLEAIFEQEPFVVVRNISSSPRTISLRTTVPTYRATAFWHDDMIVGKTLALVNNSSSNMRGSTLWVPTVEFNRIMAKNAANLPTNFYYDDPNSEASKYIDGLLQDEIKVCDWSENDNSALFFDDKKGKHKGKYSGDADSKELVQFVWKETLDFVQGQKSRKIPLR